MIGSPAALLPPSLAQPWLSAAGDPAALQRESSAAPIPRSPRPFASAPRRRPRLPPPGWPPPRSGASVPSVRRPSPSTCAMRPSSSAASATCASTASRRGPPGTRSPGSTRTGDGRNVRLHTNFPHHRDGMLKLLGCAYEREAVQAALMQWEAETFETAVAEAKLVATMMRSPAEWAAHPQGQAVARLPLFEITRIGDAPARPLPAAPSARSRTSAWSTSRASSPGRCAGARSPPTAPMSCASPHRTCRGCPSSTSTRAAASSPPPSTCAPPTIATGCAAWRARRTSSCRATGQVGWPRTVFARRAGRDASRHRRGHALRLRPRRVPGPIGADSTRWCRTPAASTSRRPRLPA